MIVNNLRYLVDKTGIKQKIIAQKIGVKENTFSRWCSGKLNPGPEPLFLMAKFFSGTLKIPIEIFRDGKAFLEDDLEKVISAYHLPDTSHPIKSTTATYQLDGRNTPLERESISRQELSFLGLLRNQTGQPEIPPQESALLLLLELSRLTGGIGTNTQNGFVTALRDVWRMKNAADGKRNEVDS